MTESWNSAAAARSSEGLELEEPWARSTLKLGQADLLCGVSPLTMHACFRKADMSTTPSSMYISSSLEVMAKIDWVSRSEGCVYKLGTSAMRHIELGQIESVLSLDPKKLGVELLSAELSAL